MTQIKHELIHHIYYKELDLNYLNDRCIILTKKEQLSMLSNSQNYIRIFFFNLYTNIFILNEMYESYNKK